MTYILHLETATKMCSVALSESGKLMDYRDFLGDGFEHGERLTTLISEILEANKLTPSDLNAVSISGGPGSYTGLRIGVSTAKGLCFALKIPLISVDTLFALAEMAWEKYPNETVMPMIDARRMEVFSAIYNGKKELIRLLQAEILEENNNADFEPYVCVGDGAPKSEALWGNRNIRFDLTIQPSARGQVNSAYSKFLAQDFEDVAYFEPNYLKEFYMAPVKKK